MKNSKTELWVYLMLGVIQFLAGALMLYTGVAHDRFWNLLTGVCFTVAGVLHLVNYVRRNP